MELLEYLEKFRYAKDTNSVALTTRENRDFEQSEKLAEQIEEAGQCIETLSEQLEHSKLLLQKYKDLVCKMQLQINARDHKI